MTKQVLRIKKCEDRSERSSPRFSLNRNFDLVMKGIGNQGLRSPRPESPSTSTTSRSSILSRLGPTAPNNPTATKNSITNSSQDVPTFEKKQQFDSSISKRLSISNLSTNSSQSPTIYNRLRPSIKANSSPRNLHEASSQPNITPKNRIINFLGRKDQTNDLSPRRSEHVGVKKISILKPTSPVPKSSFDENRRVHISPSRQSTAVKNVKTSRTIIETPSFRTLSENTKVSKVYSGEISSYARSTRNDDKLDRNDNVHNFQNSCSVPPIEDESRHVIIEKPTIRSIDSPSSNGPVDEKSSTISVFDRLGSTNSNGNRAVSSLQTTANSTYETIHRSISHPLPSANVKHESCTAKIPVKYNKPSIHPYQRPITSTDSSKDLVKIKNQSNSLRGERAHVVGDKNSNYTITPPKKHSLLSKNFPFHPQFTGSSALLPTFTKFYSTNYQFYKWKGLFPLGYFDGCVVRDTGNTNYLVDSLHAPQPNQLAQFPGPLPLNAPKLANEPCRVRCTFFPNCTNPNCWYYHPTEECPKLDGCENLATGYCFYLHPSELHVGQLCKFDERCYREDCIYLHSKRHFTVGEPLGFIASPCQEQNKTCLGVRCPYLHPNQGTFHTYTKCRANLFCTRDPCPYTHSGERFNLINDASNNKTATAGNICNLVTQPKAANVKQVFAELPSDDEDEEV